MQTTKTILNRVINHSLTEEQKQELDNQLKDLQMNEFKRLIKADHCLKGVKIA
jgi:hypothetical protein